MHKINSHTKVFGSIRTRSSKRKDASNGSVLEAGIMAEWCGGRLLRQGSDGVVCTDTRSLHEGDWFLAISGDRFDGHDFLEDARSLGCSGAIAKRVPEGWDKGFIQVDDGLVGLQSLAKNFRKNFGGTVVCITGSCGKTTAKEMTALVLQEGFPTVHQTQGNLNNHVGVPLSILRTPAAAEVMVLELGMSAAGEISLLTRISDPNVRVVMNVAPAHIGSFADGLDGIARAKAELLECAKDKDIIVLNGDDERVRKMSDQVPGCNVKFFGHCGDADIRILDVVPCGKLGLNTEIFLQERSSQQISRVEIPSPGRHLGINAAAAVAVGTSLSIPFGDCCRALNHYKPLGMRMKIESICNGKYTVLDDSYNANPASVVNALEVLANSKCNGRRIVALGDMMELGDHAQDEHEKILNMCFCGPFDVIALAGPQLKGAANKMARLSTGKVVITSETSEDLALQLPYLAEPGDTFLVKGSRSMKMERVTEGLVKALDV